MSTLSFGIKLTDSNKSIGDAMLRALLPDVKKYFDKISNNLQTKLPPIIINSIRSQPEYDSLLGGSLKAQFGIPDSASRVEAILSSIQNSVVVKQKSLNISSGQIKGGIKLQMIKSDFNDLISMGESVVVTEKGTDLNWLSWLLIEGDAIIISDYTFVAGPFDTSRTGMGIMRQSGGAWRVPPEFAGQINNNWITRAIDAAASEIDNTLQSILKG